MQAMAFAFMRQREQGRQAPGNGAGHGFTLVELMIVVMVLSIVAMAAIPAIGNVLRESRLSRAVADVAAALEYARSRAGSSGTAMRVTFPRDGLSVVVERYVPATDLWTAGSPVPAALVEGGGFRTVPHPLEQRGKAFVYFRPGDDGPSIAAAEFGGTNAVVFQSLGTPSSAGAVEIVYGGSARVVTVEGETGRIGVGD